MMTLVKKTMGFTVIIGTIIVAMSFIFPSEVIVPFIHKQELAGGLTMYLLDLRAYANNLAMTLKVDFTSMLPQMPPQFEINLDDVLLGFVLIANVLLYIINWIIFLIAWTILVPLKIIAYILFNFMAVLGLNTSSWATIFDNVYHFNIPYIPFVHL